VASFSRWECVTCTKPSADVLANSNQTQGSCASCADDSVVGNYYQLLLSRQLSHFGACSLWCFDAACFYNRQKHWLTNFFTLRRTPCRSQCGDCIMTIHYVKLLYCMYYIHFINILHYLKSWCAACLEMIAILSDFVLLTPKWHDMHVRRVSIGYVCYFSGMEGEGRRGESGIFPF